MPDLPRIGRPTFDDDRFPHHPDERRMGVIRMTETGEVWTDEEVPLDLNPSPQDLADWFAWTRRCWEADRAQRQAKEIK